MVALKQVALKPLITHRFKFKDSMAAFQCMLEGRGADGIAPVKCGPFIFHTDEICSLTACCATGIISGPEADDTAE